MAARLAGGGVDQFLCSGGSEQFFLGLRTERDGRVAQCADSCPGRAAGGARVGGSVLRPERGEGRTRSQAEPVCAAQPQVLPAIPGRF